MNANRGPGRGGLVVLAIIGLLVLFGLAVQTGSLPVPTGELDERALRFTDCAGTEKGELTVGVAETSTQQYVGLSRTESLAPNEGLLFPFDEAGTHRIEMRRMEFGLDIIFVTATGEITQIDTLDAPDSRLEYYLFAESTAGDGRFVIETHAGWSDDHGVTAGDCVAGLP